MGGNKKELCNFFFLAKHTSDRRLQMYVFSRMLQLTGTVVSKKTTVFVQQVPRPLWKLTTPLLEKVHVKDYSEFAAEHLYTSVEESSLVRWNQNWTLYTFWWWNHLKYTNCEVWRWVCHGVGLCQRLRLGCLIQCQVTSIEKGTGIVLIWIWRLNKKWIFFLLTSAAILNTQQTKLWTVLIDIAARKTQTIAKHESTWKVWKEIKIGVSKGAFEKQFVWIIKPTYVTSFSIQNTCWSWHYQKWF